MLEVGEQGPLEHEADVERAHERVRLHVEIRLQRGQRYWFCLYLYPVSVGAVAELELLGDRRDSEVVGDEHLEDDRGPEIDMDVPETDIELALRRADFGGESERRLWMPPTASMMLGSSVHRDESS